MEEEISEEFNMTEEQVEALKKELEKVKNEARKWFGLFSIKMKMPNYIRKSLKNKEWMVGNELGETTVAK